MFVEKAKWTREPLYYAVLESIVFSARTASLITLLGNIVRDNRNRFSRYS